MAAISISRMVVPFVALVTGGGVALMVAMPRTLPEPPAAMGALDAKNAAAAAPAPDARNHGVTAAFAAQSEADKLSAALAPPPTPGNDQLPEFDVVRVEPNGEAVIAGHAAPGAAVELLRNGELHDRVVADQSGQFAMIPPALPPGNHDLTLRVRQGDGRDVVSRRSVAVAVDPTPSAHAVATDALPRPSASGRADATVPAPPRLAAARATPDKPSPSSVVAPKLVTTTVSRGDSLWRISQRALGAGPRYVVIYHANMTRIRNPNLIYPGQVFVTPAR